ncbi:protein translocase subunit SecF [Thermoflexus sp.]|uniref:protein translocase subunit SecF n=1 Tax=Thermoflexus sp. TaxID=1969742 RepID=UPI00179DFFD6|nr:protein translocase subunit SecF [Thermoflexus sp.]
MIDIIGKRYWYFALSLLVIIPGLISLALYGLPLAIDYTGGSLMEIRLPPGVAASSEEVIGVVGQITGFNVADIRVQPSLQGTLIIRTREIDAPTKTRLEEALRSRYGEIVMERFESVGPTVGAEVTRGALVAVAMASLAIMLYLTFAFRQIPHAFRYGVAAVLALLHDVAVVVGTASIFGKVFGWEVDALFLTAVLTVIGFSVHDSIVVFDRIRENLIRYRGEPYERIVNHSILQTLDRSINTQLTLIFTLVALLLFGGTTIRQFIATLLIGMISGTYSSIFNAAPILVVWEKREWRTWFRRPAEQPVH